MTSPCSECAEYQDAMREVERLRDDSRMLALCERDRKEMADMVERLRAALREAARRMIANGDGFGASEVVAALEHEP
jgi:hypothetical protein